MPIAKGDDTPKTRADDYLRSLSATSDKKWLRLLVASVLATRTTPKTAILDRAFRDFLIEHELADPQPGDGAETAIETRSGTAIQGFRLSSLTHDKGVNAIAPGASLSFHPHLTVVFGKNGSGKSGFVRILKRLAGSKTQEDIWQDVRRGRSTNKCSATVAYEDSTGTKSVTWIGASGVAPFRRLGIFDGKAVPMHLIRGLAFTYQPLGFEVFPALSDSFKELQDRLSMAVRRKENERPLVDFCNQQTSSGRFLASLTAKTSVASLDEATTWTETHQQNLDQARKDRANLGNLDGQAELLLVRKRMLETLASTIGSISQDLSTASLRAYGALIKKYHALKKKRTAEKGRTLESYAIPAMESDEWQEFIGAGETYIDVAHDHHYPGRDDHCIYCLQGLSAPANRLLQLYRQLFATQEATDWEEIDSQIDSEVEQLAGMSYSKAFPYGKDDLTKCLPRSSVDRAYAAIAEGDALLKKVVGQLKRRKPEVLSAVAMGSVSASIAKAHAKIDADTRALEQARRNMIARSRELDMRILDLQDRQKLAKHRGVVERYIACEQWLTKARALDAKLSTRSITDLGKEAWGVLVSQTFRDKFKDETEMLKAPQVTIGFRGEYGSQVREKSVSGVNEIDQVLSEGEQKAVALADFFAEQAMQETQLPLVFDDPATSFDHERKELIAERLVQASAQTQVVVFTHDLMFATYLYDRVLNAKRDIDKSKAAFHDVRADSEHFGILTDNFYLGASGFDVIMKKVDEKVSKLIAMTREDQVDAIYDVYGWLRRAVEKAVEERIFGKVINRWSDQIQMHNISRASLDRNKLERARELHEKFSRYITAHNQSDEMRLHALPEPGQLRTDIADVRTIAER